MRTDNGFPLEQILSTRNKNLVILTGRLCGVRRLNFLLLDVNTYLVNPSAKEMAETKFCFGWRGPEAPSTIGSLQP